MRTVTIEEGQGVGYSASHSGKPSTDLTTKDVSDPMRPISPTNDFEDVGKSCKSR